MACYISSNNNRFYVALESQFGEVAALQNVKRFAGIQLRARQRQVRVERRDKSGSRTFQGLPPGLRRTTEYNLRSYMTAWNPEQSEPPQGPLFRSALGGAPKSAAGIAVSSVSGNTLTFGAAHGFTPGHALTFGPEIRFVAAVPGPNSVVLNAPFSTTILNGSFTGPAVSYAPGNGLPTASLYDYWSPSTAVHRIVAGSVVDQLRVRVNGDFHEFEYRGPAKDLIDSASFTAGDGNLTEFPEEPVVANYDEQAIPGHLGQVWLGSTPTRFHTLTGAEFTLDNNIDFRDREFGSVIPRCIAPGRREVRLDFTLHADDSQASKDLYAAARQQSPISVMIQLGAQQGQLFAIWLPAVVPNVPEFDDGEARLQWRFSESLGQGTLNDEVFIAFG